jgi:hypothetical protein
MSASQIFTGIALIVGLAVGCQILAASLRVPAIILLLPAGFAAGALTTPNQESEPRSSELFHRIAIGLIGEPVAPGRRRGAITARKAQRPCCSHTPATSSNCR